MSSQAAKSALSHSLRQPNVREVSMRYGERAEVLLHIILSVSNCHSYQLAQTMAEETDKLLREGALSEETLLDHVVKVLNMVRECNVALRWLLLHTAQLSPGGWCRTFPPIISRYFAFLLQDLSKSRSAAS